MEPNRPQPGTTCTLLRTALLLGGLQAGALFAASVITGDHHDARPSASVAPCANEIIGIYRMIGPSAWVLPELCAAHAPAARNAGQARPQKT